MKINKLTVVLIIIIFCLVAFIIYDKVVDKDKLLNKKENNITLKDAINLEYVNIYLLSDGKSYIAPIAEEEIDKLNVGDNLKERLSTLYLRAFYQDIYIDNYKLKGFKVNLDDTVKSIKKLEIDDMIYIIFIKDDNTIGLFNYDEYYNLLYTDVIDNYNNIENVLDIKDNKIIYLDGSNKELEVNS